MYKLIASSILALALVGAATPPPKRDVCISRQAALRWKRLEVRYKAQEARCRERVRHALASAKIVHDAILATCMALDGACRRSLRRSRCPPHQTCVLPWAIVGAVGGACVAGVIVREVSR